MICFHHILQMSISPQNIKSRRWKLRPEKISTRKIDWFCLKSKENWSSSLFQQEKDAVENKFPWRVFQSRCFQETLWKWNEQRFLLKTIIKHCNRDHGGLARMIAGMPWFDRILIWRRSGSFQWDLSSPAISITFDFSSTLYKSQTVVAKSHHDQQSHVKKWKVESKVGNVTLFLFFHARDERVLLKTATLFGADGNSIAHDVASFMFCATAPNAKGKDTTLRFHFMMFRKFINS